MNKTLTPVKTIDSREVAEMMEMKHYQILEKLEGTKNPDGTVKQIGIIPILTDQNFLVSDYFIESTYKDNSGKENKCYLFTRLGCDFIANKFTGEKGIIFTAMYVKKFAEMQDSIKTASSPKRVTSMNDYQRMMAQTRTENARIRKAQMLERMAKQYDGTYKQILHAYATKELTGEYLIPLPVLEEKTYSATEIGERLGISRNKVGSLANQYHLKTDEYGQWYKDKASSCTKEVDTFRYYEKVIPVLKAILENNETA